MKLLPLALYLLRTLQNIQLFFYIFIFCLFNHCACSMMTFQILMVTMDKIDWDSLATLSRWIVNYFHYCSDYYSLYYYSMHRCYSHCFQFLFDFVLIALHHRLVENVVVVPALVYMWTSVLSHKLYHRF